MTKQVAIGLGANLGSPSHQIQLAIERISDHPAIRFLKVSRFYITDPVGPIRNQPQFINAAMTVDTSLSPRELLMVLKSIEKEMGRDMEAERYGPRLIDCDILLFDDEHIEDDDLIIPHAELAKRAFALLPLAEIAAQWCLPDGRSVASLARLCDNHGLSLLEEVLTHE